MRRTGDVQPLGFSPESSRVLLNIACKKAGLDSDGAELLRLGGNALYRLSSAPVTVRIGRSQEDAKKEVKVGQWLASHDFPAVRLVDDLAQPVFLEDTAVTFWEFVDRSSEPVTAHDLARMLRELHRLPNPADFKLPLFHPSPKA